MKELKQVETKWLHADLQRGNSLLDSAGAGRRVYDRPLQRGSLTRGGGPWVVFGVVRTWRSCGYSSSRTDQDAAEPRLGCLIDALLAANVTSIKC